MTLFNPQAHILRLVLILGALTALTPLAIDMYIPAFPQMADYFGVPVARIELSLTTFFIGLAMGQLLYGTVSDKYGRKKPLYISLAFATLATIACVMTNDPNLFLAARFVQALGICGGAVIARAMVRDMFDHTESARFFSFLILVMGVAPILAPLAGGYISEYLGWKMIFAFISAYLIALLAVVRFALPETNRGNPEVRIRRSFHAYAEVLKDTSFLRMTLAGSFILAAMFAYVTGAPFVFIKHYGVPADQFGWIFGMNALGFIVMSQVNRSLIKRFPFESILRVGFRCVGLAALGLLAIAVFEGPMIAFIAVIFFYMLCMGAVMPNSAAMALAQQGHRAGAASAMMGFLQFGAAFVSSAAIGLSHAESQVPLATIMTIFATLGVVTYFLPNLLGRKAAEV